MSRVMIENPIAEYVRARLPSKSDEDAYFEADLALRLVFLQWPLNRDRGQVLAKATLLNELYNTRIMNIYPVVNHILKLDIDARLHGGDPTLVGDIASMRIGKKNWFRLSFAAKYCAWHEPEKFQIFDANVRWMLCEYRRAFAFAECNWDKMRDYPYFMATIDAFRERFGLHVFTRKELDKFLWMEAEHVWAEKQRAKAGKRKGDIPE